MFYKQEKAKILTAYLNEEPLASWMFFIHEDILPWSRKTQAPQGAEFAGVDKSVYFLN